jgi:hypothetical protein
MFERRSLVRGGAEDGAQLRGNLAVVERGEIEKPSSALGQSAVKADRGEQRSRALRRAGTRPAPVEFCPHVVARPAAQARAETAGVEVLAAAGPMVPLDHAQQLVY